MRSLFLCVSACCIVFAGVLCDVLSNLLYVQVLLAFGCFFLPLCFMLFNAFGVGEGCFLFFFFVCVVCLLCFFVFFGVDRCDRIHCFVLFFLHVCVVLCWLL